jgi:hypothetical protein
VPHKRCNVMAATCSVCRGSCTSRKVIGDAQLCAPGTSVYKQAATPAVTDHGVSSAPGTSVYKQAATPAVTDHGVSSAPGTSVYKQAATPAVTDHGVSSAPRTSVYKRKIRCHRSWCVKRTKDIRVQASCITRCHRSW